MEDVEAQESETLEEPAGSAQEDPQIAALKAKNAELLAEVKEARQRERQSFLSEYPSLSEDDIKGLNIQQARNLAAKLAPGAQETKPEQPKPEVAEGKTFAAHTPQVATTQHQEKISIDQAKKLPWSERRALIEAGRVEGIPPR